jgi:RNA exonuclease 4
MPLYISKAKKKEIRDRRRKKKLAEQGLLHTLKTESNSGSSKVSAKTESTSHKVETVASSPAGHKRTRVDNEQEPTAAKPQKIQKKMDSNGNQSRESVNTEVDKVKHESTETKNYNGSNLDTINFTRPIVITSSSAKDAKKLRKDVRRQARNKGIDEETLKFITVEQYEKDLAKKRKNAVYPSIKQLVQEQDQVKQRTQKEQEQHDIESQLSQDYKSKFVAIDCEMVGVGPGGETSALARVSLVDWNGNCLFDTFVKVPTKVTDYRTSVSGITRKALQSAMEPGLAREKVTEIVHDKILVGHSLDNDLRALGLTHPKADRRDTAHYRPFQVLIRSKFKPRKLKDLVKEYCHKSIQEEGKSHDSIEDARANMELFRVVRHRWEASLQRSAAMAKVR